MIRYFNMPDTRTAVALLIEPGSPAASATADQISKNFGVRLQEVTHREYRQLTHDYQEALQNG